MIDLHTHFFSRPFFDTLAALSPQPGTNEEKLAAATKKAGIELPEPDVDVHLARWLGEMDKQQQWQRPTKETPIPPALAAIGVPFRVK